jgi:hypothetical protein
MAHTQPGDLVGAASWIAAGKERDEETAQRVVEKKEEKDGLELLSW